MPPPLEMEIAEDADASPAELAQADVDPDEETPAECFSRCNRLRAELRKKERAERKQREQARIAALEAEMAAQEKQKEAEMAALEAEMAAEEKQKEAEMAALEAAMEEQEKAGTPLPADAVTDDDGGKPAAAGEGEPKAAPGAGKVEADTELDAEDVALDDETEARFSVSVRECRVACEDKCVRQCVERGKRRDLFDPAELEAACREGCVVQE